MNISAFAAELRDLGPANFLYADGDALFVHAHRRRYGDEIRPPGLHMLVRQCNGDDGEFRASGVSVVGAGQTVVMFASVPLTNEAWQPLNEGRLVVVREGAIMEQPH